MRFAKLVKTLQKFYKSPQKIAIGKNAKNYIVIADNALNC